MGNIRIQDREQKHHKNPANTDKLNRNDRAVTNILRVLTPSEQHYESAQMLSVTGAGS